MWLNISLPRKIIKIRLTHFCILIQNRLELKQMFRFHCDTVLECYFRLEASSELRKRNRDGMRNFEWSAA